MKKEQLSIKTEEKSIRACAFTGHRVLPQDFSKAYLKEVIVRAIEQGTEIFYCGMAMGFDLLAAEAVLALRTEYSHIRLVLCIPFYNQEKNFSAVDKTRYAEICHHADEQILLSETYYKGCLLARNRYMADNADALIAYCEKDTGGTAYTVNYFQKNKPNGQIFFV